MRANCDLFSKKSLKVDALFIPVFEDKHGDSSLKLIDSLLKGQLTELMRKKYFSGKSGEVHTIVPFPKQDFQKLVLIGLGKSSEVDIERLRKAAGVAGQRVLTLKASTAALVLPTLKSDKKLNSELAAGAMVEGFNLGSYIFDQYKSRKGEQEKPALLVLLTQSQGDLAKARAGASAGLLISDLQNQVRDLAGAPSNVVTPRYLANEARKVGRKHGIKVQVFGKSQIEKLKMGAFLSVAKGSAEPPHLIRFDYKPKKAAKKKIVIIGKGITFDTGGITLKPGAEMHEMKQDMAGAAVVMCTMAALAHLKPNVEVIGFIPTCENMPGSRAYKPGDVLTTSIGKTIEVISTDAEGRLLLADVLGYASTKIEPDYMIDVATLTGAVIVALGHAGAGMLSTSEDLIKRFNEASAKTGEKVWQMPLWPEFEHQIKSPVADMKNSGGRPGGTCVAATILKHFVGDVPWLHLDIAGMDIEYRGSEYTPKGASGYGMRLLTEVICNL